MDFNSDPVVDYDLQAALCRDSYRVQQEFKASEPEPFAEPRTPVKLKPGTRRVPHVPKGHGARKRWAMS